MAAGESEILRRHVTFQTIFNPTSMLLRVALEYGQT
jgi:hypothetical protein